MFIQLKRYKKCDDPNMKVGDKEIAAGRHPVHLALGVNSTLETRKQKISFMIH